MKFTKPPHQMNNQEFLQLDEEMTRQGILRGPTLNQTLGRRPGSKASLSPIEEFTVAQYRKVVEAQLAKQSQYGTFLNCLTPQKTLFQEWEESNPPMKWWEVVFAIGGVVLAFGILGGIAWNILSWIYSTVVGHLS